MTMEGLARPDHRTLPPGNEKVESAEKESEEALPEAMPDLSPLDEAALRYLELRRAGSAGASAFHEANDALDAEDQALFGSIAMSAEQVLHLEEELAKGIPTHDAYVSAIDELTPEARQDFDTMLHLDGWQINYEDGAEREPAPAHDPAAFDRISREVEAQHERAQHFMRDMRVRAQEAQSMPDLRPDELARPPRPAASRERPATARETSPAREKERLEKRGSYPTEAELLGERVFAANTIAENLKESLVEGLGLENTESAKELSRMQEEIKRLATSDPSRFAEAKRSFDAFTAYNEGEYAGLLGEIEQACAKHRIPSEGIAEIMRLRDTRERMRELRREIRSGFGFWKKAWNVATLGSYGYISSNGKARRIDRAFKERFDASERTLKERKSIFLSFFERRGEKEPRAAA